MYNMSVSQKVDHTSSAVTNTSSTGFHNLIMLAMKARLDNGQLHSSAAAAVFCYQ